MADRAFVPADFSIPGELVAPPFRLEPLGPQHNGADYAAWTSSIEHSSATPGFIGRDWPDPAMSPDDNLADLQRHADDFPTVGEHGRQNERGGDCSGHQRGG